MAELKSMESQNSQNQNGETIIDDEVGARPGWSRLTDLWRHLKDIQSKITNKFKTRWDLKPALLAATDMLIAIEAEKMRILFQDVNTQERNDIFNQMMGKYIDKYKGSIPVAKEGRVRKDRLKTNLINLCQSDTTGPTMAVLARRIYEIRFPGPVDLKHIKICLTEAISYQAFKIIKNTRVLCLKLPLQLPPSLEGLVRTEEPKIQQMQMKTKIDAFDLPEFPLSSMQLDYVLSGMQNKFENYSKQLQGLKEEYQEMLDQQLKYTGEILNLQTLKDISWKKEIFLEILECIFGNTAEGLQRGSQALFLLTECKYDSTKTANLFHFIKEIVPSSSSEPLFTKTVGSKSIASTEQIRQKGTAPTTAIPRCRTLSSLMSCKPSPSASNGTFVNSNSISKSSGVVANSSQTVKLNTNKKGNFGQTALTPGGSLQPTSALSASVGSSSKSEKSIIGTSGKYNEANESNPLVSRHRSLGSTSIPPTVMPCASSGVTDLRIGENTLHQSVPPLKSSSLEVNTSGNRNINRQSLAGSASMWSGPDAAKTKSVTATQEVFHRSPSLITKKNLPYLTPRPNDMENPRLNKMHRKKIHCTTPYYAPPNWVTSTKPNQTGSSASNPKELALNVDEICSNQHKIIYEVSEEVNQGRPLATNKTLGVSPMGPNPNALEKYKIPNKLDYEKTPIKAVETSATATPTLVSSPPSNRKRKHYRKKSKIRQHKRETEASKYKEPQVQKPIKLKIINRNQVISVDNTSEEIPFLLPKKRKC